MGSVASVHCTGTPRQEESNGKTARSWEDSARCSRGLALFCYYLIYFFLIRANEAELQERCKSLIGEWIFRALPGCSLCYENITARAGVGNFQAALLTGWKEKHLPAQMSSQRKGRSRGFFHPQQFHRASCKSPGFPPLPHRTLPRGRQWLGTPRRGTTGQGCRMDGQKSPGCFHEISLPPYLGTHCSGRFMWGSCPWKKNLSGKSQTSPKAHPPPAIMPWCKGWGFGLKPGDCCSNQAASLFLLGFISQNRLILV